jgi:cellulose synthase/poly-beta-1,6-N-acetylglucosamine synthase-like glycosyltransferase
MIFIFYVLAAVLVFLSFRSFRGGIEYLRFFKSELAKAPSDFAPFVTVIVPCRGLDAGLAENLRSLVDQDYPNHETLFVVDDKNDGAVPIIEKVMRTKAETRAVASVPDTKLIVANSAKGCSQKVENLREGVLHAADRSEAFVFADSDVRPSKIWLRSLVAPLQNEQVGAATGYRWFISEKPGFASEMRSAWNASIASALGPNTKTNFCWGGSMAIRRDVFKRIEMREKWRGTLSDDFAVTRAMSEAGLPIVFVPQALTASVENCTFRELLEFTTRQMKITRVYARHLWALSLFGSAVFTSVMLASWPIVVFRNTSDFAVFAAMVTLLLVTIFSVGKAWLRLKAVRLVLRQYRSELERQFWTQNTFWLVTPVIFLYNSLAALFSRRLLWRGIRYELKSPTETVIITD